MERHIAYHVPISFVLNGEYEKGEGEMAPNYVIGNNLKVARANILGIVVKIENDSVFTIDDGSGKISIRVFEQVEHFFKPTIGEIVNIIGKPRAYNNERYIVPEIIRKSNEKWIKVRKEELKKFNFEKEKEEEKEEKDEMIIESVEGGVDNHEKILQFIKNNDKGEGVEVQKIIDESKIENSEKIIENMLKEGELFENMPGKIKILE